MSTVDLRYIGARYVPRFMGTYDPTQVYEVLDVVDGEDEFLYISKQPVPRNTPPSNRTYWAVYGHIQNVQNQIDAINDEIADMKDGTVAGSLQNQINANDDEIADMKDGTVVGSLQNQISGILTKLQRLEVSSFVITASNSVTITTTRSGTFALILGMGNVISTSCIYSLRSDGSNNARMYELSTSDMDTGSSISVNQLTNNSLEMSNAETGNGATFYVIKFSGDFTIT